MNRNASISLEDFAELLDAAERDMDGATHQRLLKAYRQARKAARDDAIISTRQAIADLVCDPLSNGMCNLHGEYDCTMPDRVLDTMRQAIGEVANLYQRERSKVQAVEDLARNHEWEHDGPGSAVLHHMHHHLRAALGQCEQVCCGASEGTS